MILFQYSAVLVQDEDGGFVVTFPDFPEAVAQGETEQEALEAAADSIEEAVANRIMMNLDLPAPMATGASYTVIVPASTALKAALYQAIRSLKISKVQVAALLGVDEKEVRRLLDPYHPSKLTRIEELMKRLDRRIVVGLQQPMPAEVNVGPAHQPDGRVVWESEKKASKNLYIMPLTPESKGRVEPAAPSEIAS
jgi:antitoxin HicB